MFINDKNNDGLLSPVTCRSSMLGMFTEKTNKHLAGPKLGFSFILTDNTLQYNYHQQPPTKIPSMTASLAPWYLAEEMESRDDP